MASRRITRETFEAVVQDKVKRYRSGAAGDAVHHFPAHSRAPPRPRYSESFQQDGRFPHANCQHQDWSQEPGQDYPGESYPGEDYSGENYPGENYPEENYPEENYPGPSYRPASPLLRKENYFHGHFSRPAPREREFRQDFGKFGRAAAPSREYGQHPSPQGREYGQQRREYGRRDRDYGQQQDYGPSDSWEAGGQHGAGFGSSEVLGDFRSPGLMEEEYGSVESHEGEGDGEFRPPLRRGGAGRARVLRGKRLTRGVLKPKGFKGDLKSPLKKWNVKKAQHDPQLDPKALEQPVEGGEQRPAPLQQRPGPKLPPQPGAAQRALLRLPKPAHVFRNLNFDLVDKSDIFSTFGVEIIKWAGFHAIKNDAEFSRLFGALFELETETCAKMLASFKCSLRPEHRDYCFFTIKSLQHAALKTPKVDNEFLNMLLDKGAVKTKNCFFEIIKPFDKYIMRLQDRLLKGVTPLLMACNAYELSLKTSGFGSPGDMASAFETTVSLCRKSLALLGQTFALASVFRQEKILEAVGLQEMAPAPTAFPNLDDSTLFGREYMEHLRAWLDRSGYPIQMRRAEPGPTELKTPDPKAPQRADRSVLAAIERLVSSTTAGTARDRDSQHSDPDYWFLCDEESLEYKYYRLRLAEVQRSSVAGAGAGPAPGSLRALLCARRVASLKRRLFRRRARPVLAPGRARRARRASTGTQTLLSAGPGLRQPGRGPAGARAALAQHGGLGATSAPPGATSAPPGATSASPGVTSAPPGATSAPPGATSAPPGVTSASPGATSAPPGATSAPQGVTSDPPGASSAPCVTSASSGVTSASPGVTLDPPGVTSAPPGATSAPCASLAPQGVTSASPGVTSDPPDVTSASPGATSAPPGPSSASQGATLDPPGVTSAPPGATSAPPGVTSAPPGATSAPPGGSSCQVPEAAEAQADPEALAADPELPPAWGAQFADVDARTRETAEKLARFVAQVGPEIEQFSIDNSADNPELWFLQDQTSPAFKFYRMKVLELCPSISFSPEAAEAARAAGTALGAEEDEEEEEEDEEEEEEEEEEAEFEPSQAEEEDEDDEEDVAAGRRVTKLEEDLVSRAGEEVSGGDVQLSSPPDGAVPNLSTQAPGPAPGFPRKRVSSKSLRVGMIPAPKRICLIQEPKVHEPVRIAYDRPRGCPVTKKKKKARAVELAQKRLSPRNLGFQMLQRMGWQEGHGLGTRGRGIREPLALGATSAGEGLGVAGEENQEDAFDIFRQRMIQMYRQKRANK